MKKRLRKKLRRGEFRELGFNVWLETVALDESGYDAFWDALIVQLESQGLGFGGGGRAPCLRLYVAALHGHGRAVVDADRLAVARWLDGRPEVKRVAVGLLEDAWYPPRDSGKHNPLRPTDG